MDLLDIYNSQNEFGRKLNMSYNILRPGELEYHMVVEKDLIALNNYAHGGAIAAFMDAILGVSALSMVASENLFVSTVEFKINFLHPAELGDELIGYGKVLKKGKSILVVEGEIKTSKNLIAKALGTFNSYPSRKISS